MRTAILRRLRLPLALAAAALALGAAVAVAQTCSISVAARGAVASSYVDTMLNGSDPEDAGFFTRTGGVPNIFFLLDNSASMVRLPPNGGGFYPGTYPPLHDPNCPTGGDDKDPSCRYRNLYAPTLHCPSMDGSDTTGCAVIGCGDDPVSASFAGAGMVIGWFRDRQYFPPCTITDGHYGAKYGFGPTGTFVHDDDTSVGENIDYAQLASPCRYYSQGSDAVTSGAPGYDPDFYCESDGSTVSCGGQTANFFDKYPVFHDAVVNIQTGAPGDGWTYAAARPWKKAGGNNVGTTDEFCNEMFADGVYQGSQLKRTICTRCLERRGFFFDGRLFRASTAMDGLDNVGYPSVWFTGNWLNFYPPKFIVARKVLKDAVMDKVRVRMGIAHFGATGADHANDEWQKLKPTCDMPDSSWTSARSGFINQVNDYAFDQGTPIARALLDIGQYYHSPELPWFGIDGTWNTTNNTSGGGSESQQSVCYACQTSTVVLITDGIPKSTDGNDLPVGTVTETQLGADYAGDTDHGIKPTVSGTTRTGGIPTGLCSACSIFPVADDWKNNPIRVAWYLHNLDLRKNDEGTLDCRTMNGKQVLDVYTVGFATSQTSGAETLLSNMAAMGGGQYVSADNTASLRSGLDAILTTIEDRTTSFSVASVSTLQTTAGRSVIVPRFDPARETGRLWPGHLVRYELFSEFLSPTCTETSDGSGAGDLDCDGKCLSVFLQDRTGDFIQEDDNGIFRKNDPPDAADCDQASRCTSFSGKTCAVAGTQEATEHWDAAEAIRAQTWRTGRRVYTAVDDSGPSGTPDGKIDRFDTTFRLEATDAVAAKIMPYLRLGGSGSGLACEAVANAIATRGDPVTAAAVRVSRTYCTKTLIRFVLGADVFNDNGAKPTVGGVWPKPATEDGQNSLPDRNVVLGDIFHSAPVVIDPPLPPDGVLCKNGLHNQCLTSLWKTPTPHSPSSANAYDVYAQDSRYKNRRKIILVGANDGLLHAFDAGVWEANANDTLTDGIDESLPPFNGYYTRGTGREVWAFLPPDLLPKIPMLATGHQLFVDGSPMIRDVWVDGTTNAISGTAANDGQKQSNEFHTVAIVGERRGGTRYFALDVTEATKMPTEAGHVAPKFLWVYPQPNDAESLTFGETYNDYLPVRPPVGPVRVKVDGTSNALFGTSTASGTMAVAGVTGGVPYHERWVTFLAGGFDPQGIKGRGVHMVDVWTGHELFDFSRPTSGCGSTDTDPRCHLKAPIAATVAMLMWGTSASANTSFGNEFFFDTATFGDTAGQLWTLRFSDPGTLDGTSKRATNWHGGRSFQLTGCSSEPFFYITANTQVPGGWLRTYAGTGDRYNLLDTFGGQCGPDNLRACAQRGCTVTVSSTSDANTFACTGLVRDGAVADRETSGLALAACSSTDDTFFSSTSRALSSLSTCTLEGKANVTIDCGNNRGATAKNRHVSCVDSADGVACGYVTDDRGSTVDLDDRNNVIQKHNWYFSIRVFDTTTARGIFRTPEQAAAYDAARLTVSSPSTASSGVVVIDGGVDNPTALADASSSGWAMYFNHDGQREADDHVFQVSRYDERVSSTTALYGLVTWSTLQPGTGTVVRSGSNSQRCQVAKCVAENRRVAYHYGADPITGGSVLRDANGNLVRSVASTTLVPAMGDQPTVFVNQKGQVQVALTAVNPERGATNITSGVMRDPAPSFGVIPISKDVHACRHSAAEPAAGVCP
ncbi:MAG TPA: pilus assembly protein PilY [Anaeromyxobacter sp.]|nr:pilus assembly protein PilY [Anaeromyxobacter sp.]